MKIYLKIWALTVVLSGAVQPAGAQVQPQGASSTIQTRSVPAVIPKEIWENLRDFFVKDLKRSLDKISVGGMSVALPQNIGDEQRFYAQFDVSGAFVRLNRFNDISDDKGGRGFGGKVLPFTVKALGNGAYQYSVGVFAFENMNAYSTTSSGYYGRKYNGFTVFNNLRFGTLNVDRGYTRAGVLNTELEIFGTDARVALAESEWGWIGVTGGAGVNFTLYRQLEGVTENGAPLRLAAPHSEDFPIGIKTYAGARVERTGKLVRVALEQRLNYENTGGHHSADTYNNKRKEKVRLLIGA